MRSTGAVGVVVTLLAAISTLGWLNIRSDEPAKVANRLPSCEIDYQLCKDNADVANNNSNYHYAKDACMSKLRNVAKYGEPRDRGYNLRFSMFTAGDDFPRTGVAILISKISMQNRYGTYVNGTEYCEYDLRANKVIKLWGDLNNYGGFFEGSIDSH